MQTNTKSHFRETGASGHGDADLCCACLINVCTYHNQIKFSGGNINIHLQAENIYCAALLKHLKPQASWPTQFKPNALETQTWHEYSRKMNWVKLGCVTQPHIQLFVM